MAMPAERAGGPRQAATSDPLSGLSASVRPLGGGVESVMTPLSSSQLPDLSGLTVLVVDDDEDAIKVLTTMMTACGAEVIFARSAPEGLANLDTTSHLDVVITDISMPGIDGYEFTRKIRQHSSPVHRALPIIALTGFHQTYVITETFDAFLQKPVDLDRLCAVIKILLARRRPSSERLA